MAELGAIFGFIQHFYAVLALVPILPFAIVLFGYGAYVQDRKKALRMAMDVSTIFFILCVAAMFNILFNSKFGPYGILLFMLLGAGVLGNAQYRKRGSVDAKRIFKAIWRLSFFATTFLYILFSIILLTKHFINAA